MRSAVQVLGYRRRWAEVPQHQRGFKLAEMLVDFGSHEATLTHDKVYGLLGLTRISMAVAYLVYGVAELLADVAHSNTDEACPWAIVRAFVKVCYRIWDLEYGTASMLCIRILQHFEVISREAGFFLGVFQFDLTYFSDEIVPPVDWRGVMRCIYQAPIATIGAAFLAGATWRQVCNSRAHGSTMRIAANFQSIPDELRGALIQILS
jgi:hypothetical protein